MNMRFWIILSLVIHLVVAVAFSLRITYRSKAYVDLSYITVTDFQERQEQETPPQVTPRREGDITPSETPVIETNEEPAPSPPPRQEFLPFYMVDELPVPLARISPPYPEEARRLGIEGAVVVKIYINERGEVEDVEVTKSPDRVLSEAVVKTVRGTRFSPAKAGGKSVPVILELTLRFKLQ